MQKSTWTFPLGRKRDALLARQRARQLAALLGYEFLDQACIAAGVFAVAWQVVDLGVPVELCFEIDEPMLRVFARASEKCTMLRLEKRLPAGDRGLAFEDIDWCLKKLDQVTPAQLYEEVFRQNQELLAALHTLQDTQSALRNSQALTSNPSAA